MKKRLKAGALLALPALLMLGACSASGDGGPGAQPSDEPTADVTDEPTEISPDIEETLTVWTYHQDKTDVMIQADMFAELYPNVTVDIVYVPQEEFANKVIASAASKTGPDLLWYNPAYTTAFADAGVVMQLDDRWATFEDRDQFPTSVLSSANGGVYGVQTYVGLNALWYNQEILDEVGVDAPTTLDELEAALKAVTDAGYVGLQIPGTPAIEGEWISKPFFEGYGISGFSAMDDPKVEEMFTRVSGWVDDGYIIKGNLSLSQGDGLSKFLEGETAFFVGGSFQLGPGAEATFPWGVTAMPAGPHGPGTVYIGGQSEAIGTFAKNPDLAWAFFEKTWLTKEFQLTKAETGNIPSRKDAIPPGADDKVTAYSAALENAVPLSSDTASTLEVGNLWSAVLTGQTSPSSGAATAAQIAKNAE